MLFIATLTFALGTNPITLVIARFLQGASAGIVYTVGLALLVDTVGRDEVGTWMGFALSGMSTGVMVGPFLGGIIYAKAGYFAVFAVMLGVIAFDFVLRLFMIEKKTAAIWRESSHGGNDYGTFSNDSDGNRKPGDAVFGEHEESSENSSINSSGSSIEEDPIKQVPPELAPASLTIPYRPSLAKRFKKRFVSQFPTIGTLLGSSRLIAAMYGGFINISLICSFDSILPLFVHKTFGWDSSGTGIIFLAITIPSLGAPLVGALSDRLGSRVVVLSGFVISALALALMMIVQHDSLKQIILLCGLLALTGAQSSPNLSLLTELPSQPQTTDPPTGIGTTLMLAPLAADMFAIVEQLGKDNKGLFGPAGAYAQAYGLFDTALACGTMFGPAFVGFMYGKVGWKVAVLGLAVFCVSGCVPVVRFSEKKKV